MQNLTVVLDLLERVYMNAAVGDLLDSLAKTRERNAHPWFSLSGCLAAHGDALERIVGSLNGKPTESLSETVCKSLGAALDALHELDELVGSGDADLVEGVHQAEADVVAILRAVRIPDAILSGDAKRARRVSQWAKGERRRLRAKARVSPVDGADVNAEGTGQPAVALRIADMLEALRDDWREGDRRMMKLLASGFQAASGGYEKIMREDVRGSVRERLKTMRSDPGLLASIGHLDPGMRDELLAVMRKLDPDGWGTDRYGEEGDRWRCTWEAIGLDGEFDDLLLKLRIAASAVRQQIGDSKPTPGNHEAETKAVGSGDVTWQAVRDGLRAKVKRGEPYTTTRELAKDMGCSDALIRKAIDGAGVVQPDKVLQGWRDGAISRRRGDKSVKADQVEVLDHKPGEGGNPLDAMIESESAETTNRGAVWAGVVDKATPSERANLNAMSEEQRNAVIDAVLESRREEQREHRQARARARTVRTDD